MAGFWGLRDVRRDRRDHSAGRSVVDGDDVWIVRMRECVQREADFDWPKRRQGWNGTVFATLRSRICLHWLVMQPKLLQRSVVARRVHLARMLPLYPPDGLSLMALRLLKLRLLRSGKAFDSRSLPLIHLMHFGNSPSVSMNSCTAGHASRKGI